MRNRLRPVLGSVPHLDPLEPRRFLSGNGVIDVTQGLPDLQVTISEGFSLPENFISGTGKAINLPLTITNVDRQTETGRTIAVPGTQTAIIRVVARPQDAADNSLDIQIGSIGDLALAGLAVGASKSASVPLVFDDDIGGGSWRIVVTLDGANTIRELDEDPNCLDIQANNTAQTEPFPITVGRPDLRVTVTDAAIPDAMMSGLSKIYRVPIRVTNHGTLATPKSTITTVKVTLVSQTDEASTAEILTPVQVKVSNLRPGGSVNAVALVYFPNTVNGGEGVELDQQVFTFEVDPEDKIKELDEENNAADSKTFDVELGAPGLLFEPPANQHFPNQPVLSGTGQPFQLAMKVTNFGNLPWDPDGSVTTYITPFIEQVGYDPGDVPDEGGEWEHEIELDMAKLNPGKSRNLSFDWPLARNLESGGYHAWVRLRAVGLDGEEFVDYFQVTAEPFQIQMGYVNLVPTIAGGGHLPPVTLSGDGSTFTLPLTIRNEGNVATDDGAKIQAQIELWSVDLDAKITEMEEPVELEIGAIAPGRSKQVQAGFFFEPGAGLPEGLPDDYFVVVRLVKTDEAAGVAEPQEFHGDNGTASELLRVVQGNPDLTVLLPGNLRLPEGVIGGAAKPINLPVTVRNLGNLPIAESTTTQIKVYAVDSLDERTLVATYDADISSLKPNASKKFTVPVLLGSDLASGDYTFEVTVDQAGNIDELDDANNDARSEASVAVTRGVPDLAATINAGALEGAAVRSGDGSKLTLPLSVRNLGNLLVQKDQLVSIRLFAVAEGSETQTEIAVIPGVKVGGMKPNATKNLTLKFTLPVDLATGAYQLCAEVDSEHELTELGDDGSENGDNNTAGGPNVNVTRFGADLTLAFGDAIDLPAEVVSGDGTPLSVPLVLTNSGSYAAPRGQKITIRIYAHNQADAASEADDVLVHELSNVSIGGLAAGASKTFNLTVKLPAGVGPGNIVLVARADSANDLAELNESNNSAASGPLSDVA